MSSQIGRNNPCPCGSGKKYKNCCYKRGIIHSKKTQNKAALFVFGAVVLVAVAVTVSKIISTPSTKSKTTTGQSPISTAPNFPTQASSATGTTTAVPGSPQPSGPVPPGKVWSVEHGHWHDLPTTNVLSSNTSTQPNASAPASSSPVFDITPGQIESQTQAQGILTPQPPGPVPEGKVWSPEHGHWHNVPGPEQVTNTNQQPGQPGQLIPQPPGPAPEGKVWSAEHGHWHDAPVEPKTIQVAPSTSGPK